MQLKDTKFAREGQVLQRCVRCAATVEAKVKYRAERVFDQILQNDERR